MRIRPVRLSVRTAPFHGAERGSIPLGLSEVDADSAKVRAREDDRTVARAGVW